MPSSFAALIFLPGEGPEYEGAVDWYGKFLERTWPMVDGAVDVDLLAEANDSGASSGLAVALQRWRDRPSYEIYRSESGQESAKKLMPLKQEVEYLLPVGSIGETDGGAKYFLVRVASGPETPAVAVKVKQHIETEGARAPGFLGARVWVREMGDAVFALTSWKTREDFRAWRDSKVGADAAAYLRKFKPMVWRLAPRSHARGLSFG